MPSRRLALFALAILSTPRPAAAASLLEKNFWLPGQHYHGVLPFCEDGRVAAAIAARFSRRERGYWSSPLTIRRIDRVRELAYRPWGASYIPRRFCKARALISDGRFRDVSYAIAEDQGIIGMTWGVEWCVQGLDRNLAYAPDCEMARP